MANRISAIHEGSTPDRWRHVPGKENPADLASRGVKATNTDRLYFWLNGSKFFWDEESVWPPSRYDVEPDEKDIKIRRDRTVNVKNHEVDILDSMFDRYSDWYKLSRAVAWLLRFKSYCLQGSCIKMVLLASIGCRFMKLTEHHHLLLAMPSVEPSISTIKT